jgi:hypothetical protein
LAVIHASGLTVLTTHVTLCTTASDLALSAATTLSVIIFGGVQGIDWGLDNLQLRGFYDESFLSALNQSLGRAGHHKTTFGSFSMCALSHGYPEKLRIYRG